MSLFNSSSVTYDAVCNTYSACFSTQHFGIDYGGPLPEEEEREDTIVVPRVNHGIFGSEYYDLCLAIDPLEHSSNYGIDIYLCVLEYVLS